MAFKTHHFRLAGPIPSRPRGASSRLHSGVRATLPAVRLCDVPFKARRLMGYNSVNAVCGSHALRPPLRKRELFHFHRPHTPCNVAGT